PSRCSITAAFWRSTLTTPRPIVPNPISPTPTAPLACPAIAVPRPRPNALPRSCPSTCSSRCHDAGPIAGRRPRPRAGSDLRLAQEAPDAPHRLPDAVLVLDQREAHEALARLAEADARRDRDARLPQQPLRELERAEGAEPLGDRSP